jgi:hypothetical protein
MMSSLKIEELLTDAFRNNTPSSTQRHNLETVLKCSDRFSEEAGTAAMPASPQVPERFIVVESGHQPNFFPNSGVLKKAFYLSHLAATAKSLEIPAFAIFGFADQNLSSAPYLHENRIPAWNSQGYQKIGFKIARIDRLKQFRAVSKPSVAEWEKEWARIRKFYEEQSTPVQRGTDRIAFELRSIRDMAAGCYERAGNFADLNAFLLASLCRDTFNLPVWFFRYSDIQKEQLFGEVVFRVLTQREEYIRTYNQAVTRYSLKFPLLHSDHVPLWLHCSCGGKVPLTILGQSSLHGTCPLCGSEHIQQGAMVSIDAVRDALPMLGLNAVSRHLAFFEGLGTSVFISGAGGGLRYGRIADDIARKFLMRVPSTIALISRDFYLSPTHLAAIHECARMFRISHATFLQNDLQEVLTSRLNAMHSTSSPQKTGQTDKRATGPSQGAYENGVNRLAMVQSLFSTIPSCIDPIIYLGSSEVSHGWKEEVAIARVNLDDPFHYVRIDYIGGDLPSFVATQGEIPRLYQNMEGLEVRDDKKSPGNQPTYR